MVSNEDIFTYEYAFMNVKFKEFFNRNKLKENTFKKLLFCFYLT